MERQYIESVEELSTLLGHAQLEKFHRESMEELFSRMCYDGENKIELNLEKVSELLKIAMEFAYNAGRSTI